MLYRNAKVLKEDVSRQLVYTWALMFAGARGEQVSDGYLVTHLVKELECDKELVAKEQRLEAEIKVRQYVV